MNGILDQIEIDVDKIKIPNSTLDQWQ